MALLVTRKYFFHCTVCTHLFNTLWAMHIKSYTFLLTHMRFLFKRYDLNTFDKIKQNIYFLIKKHTALKIGAYISQIKNKLNSEIPNVYCGKWLFYHAHFSNFYGVLHSWSNHWIACNRIRPLWSILLWLSLPLIIDAYIC